MEKDPQGVTSAMLLDHMRGMEDRLGSSIDGVEKGLRSRIDDVEKGLGKKINDVDRRLTLLEAGVDNLVEAVDNLEIAVVGQKHEERIARLETHTGLVSA